MVDRKRTAAIRAEDDDEENDNVPLQKKSENRSKAERRRGRW